MVVNFHFEEDVIFCRIGLVILSEWILCEGYASDRVFD